MTAFTDNIKLGDTTHSLTLNSTNNSATLNIDTHIFLDKSYKYAEDQYIPAMELELYSKAILGMPRIGGKLSTTVIPEGFYPNVPWRCVNKEIRQREENEGRIYVITSSYEALGISYSDLNTPSVRLLAVTYSPENYDFSVRNSYYNTDLGDSGSDYVTTPTKLIANSIGDPLVEGERQVRSLGILKFTMEYDSNIFVVEDLDTYYNNTINVKDIKVLGRTIKKYKGLLNIDSIESFVPHNDEQSYYRVTYSIKHKNSLDSNDSWIVRELNQGFRFKAISTPTGIRPILNGDINANIKTGAYKDLSENPISEPQPLTKAGAILTDITNPYWLQFQVQPCFDWTPLGFPELLY